MTAQRQQRGDVVFDLGDEDAAAEENIELVDVRAPTAESWAAGPREPE